ncbi:MAG: hypothetical protein OXG05_10625 [Gammaproteobacteria bacterium]|nr:hypothetical protein [Gammaproteobacteria bacterium]
MAYVNKEIRIFSALVMLAISVSVVAQLFQYTNRPDGDEVNVWGGERATLDECLLLTRETVKRQTGTIVMHREARIDNDTPTLVDGWYKFPNLYFKCELKRTGTRGTYWDGTIHIRRSMLTPKRYNELQDELRKRHQP